MYTRMFGSSHDCDKYRQCRNRGAGFCKLTRGCHAYGNSSSTVDDETLRSAARALAMHAVVGLTEVYNSSVRTGLRAWAERRALF